MEIYISKSGQQIGPFPEQQVRMMIQSGMINPADLGWIAGNPSWIPLHQILNLTPPAIGTSTSNRQENYKGALRTCLICLLISAILGFAAILLGVYLEQRNQRAEEKRLADREARRANKSFFDLTPDFDLNLKFDYTDFYYVAVCGAGSGIFLLFGLYSGIWVLFYQKTESRKLK